MTNDAEGSVVQPIPVPETPPEWWPAGWPWPPFPTPTSADDVSQLEAWAAKIDRDFEEFSDRLHREPYDDRRLKEKLDDERFDEQTHARDRQAARDQEERLARDAQRDSQASRASAIQAELNRLYDRQAQQQGDIRSELNQLRDRQAQQREDTRSELNRLYDRQAKREEDRGKVDDELRHHRLQMEQMLLTAYLERNNDSHNMTLQVLADSVESARVARAVTWNVQFNKAMDQMLAQKVQDAVSTALKEFMGPPRGGVTPAPSWGYPPGQPTPSTGQ